MTNKINSSKYFGVLPKSVKKEFREIDKEMQSGYGLLEKNKEVAAVKIWAKTFDEIKSYIEANNIESLDKFEKIFNGSQFVENWVQDYEMALGNVIADSSGKNKEAYAKQLLDVLEFFIKISDKDDYNNLARQRALAETFYILRDVKKGEEIYLNLIKTNPDFVWGYIGYSDEYWMNDEDDKDYKKAKRILSQALEIENLEDREVAEERLEDLNREIKKQ